MSYQTGEIETRTITHKLELNQGFQLSTVMQLVTEKHNHLYKSYGSYVTFTFRFNLKKYLQDDWNLRSKTKETMKISFYPAYNLRRKVKETIRTSSFLDELCLSRVQLFFPCALGFISKNAKWSPISPEHQEFKSFSIPHQSTKAFFGNNSNWW